MQIASELADLMVVVYGTASVLGIELDDVFREIMRANMRKIGDDGRVRRREDGKILKPDGWYPADIGSVLNL